MRGQEEGSVTAYAVEGAGRLLEGGWGTSSPHFSPTAQLKEKIARLKCFDNALCDAFLAYAHDHATAEKRDTARERLVGTLRRMASGDGKDEGLHVRRGHGRAEGPLLLVPCLGRSEPVLGELGFKIGGDVNAMRTARF